MDLGLYQKLEARTLGTIEKYQPLFGVQPRIEGFDFSVKEQEFFQIIPNGKKYDFVIPSFMMREYAPDPKTIDERITQRFIEDYVPTHEGFEILLMQLPELPVFNSNIKHSWANHATREALARCDKKTYKRGKEIVGNPKEYPLPGTLVTAQIRELSKEIGLERAIGFSNHQTDISAPNLDSHIGPHDTWDWAEFALRINKYITHAQE